jgi:hypothetical protein
MSPAMHDLIQSPQGILMICASMLIGICVGLVIMAAIGWWEHHTAARLRREMDAASGKRKAA